LFVVLVLFNACTEDQLTILAEADSMDATDEMSFESETAEEEGSTTETPTEEITCTDTSRFVFNEKDGLLLVEFEKA
jgi:hypothetical protein